MVIKTTSYNNDIHTEYINVYDLPLQEQELFERFYQVILDYFNNILRDETVVIQTYTSAVVYNYFYKFIVTSNIEYVYEPNYEDEVEVVRTVTYNFTTTTEFIYFYAYYFGTKKLLKTIQEYYKSQGYTEVLDEPGSLEPINLLELELE